LLNPYTIAEAIDIPNEADFPRPLPAVKLIVPLRLFSEILSTNYITDVAWSYVLHISTKFPIGLVSLKSYLRSFNFFYSAVK